MMHSRDIDRVALKPRPQITGLWEPVNEAYPDMREHVSGAEKIMRGFQAIAAAVVIVSLALLIIHAVVTATCASCGV